MGLGYSPFKNLDALLLVVRSLEAELAAHAAAHVRLPRCREEELADTLLVITAEAPRHVQDLPAPAQAVVHEARARMLAAVRGIEFASQSSTRAPKYAYRLTGRAVQKSSACSSETGGGPHLSKPRNSHRGSADA